MSHASVIQPRRRRSRRRLLLVGFGIGAFWAVFTGVSHAAGEEGCFTSKINGARAASGIPGLTSRSDLVSIARRHSARMASSGTIYHNGNLPNEAPSDWQSLGENVGMGPSCDEIHTAFMNSASHRKNILDRDFNYVGVGVVIADDGTVYVTQVFMQAPAPSGGGTTTSPPRTTTPRAPRTTTPRAPRTPAPPTQAPTQEPPPPPPPPPGSKVTGDTAAYFDILEKEELVSPEQVRRYVSAKRGAEIAAAEERAERMLRGKAPPGLLARVSSLIGAVLVGSF